MKERTQIQEPDSQVDDPDGQSEKAWAFDTTRTDPGFALVELDERTWLRFFKTAFRSPRPAMDASKTATASHKRTGSCSILGISHANFFPMDLKFALRSLLKNPGFTLLAVLVMGSFIEIGCRD